VAVVWLVFPIMLLSALSGTSRWYVLHWEFLRRLPRRPIALAVFYLSTALVLLIGGGSLYLAILHPNPYAAAAIVPLAACVLIQGRLFGRLGWVVGQTPVGAKPARKRRLRGVVASDPWQVPLRRDDPPPAPTQETAFTALEPRPISTEVTAATAPDDVEEDEWTPNKKPYALLSDAPPMIQASNPLREAITAAPHARADDDEDSAAALNMLPATPLEPDPQHQPEPPKLDHIEVRWQEGRKMPVLPRWPLLGGVWEFPFYSTALERLVILSALCLALVLVIRFMLILARG